MIDKMDKTVLNGIIIGRVEPHIYAFSTQTVPNYLKVGDTYRPIEQRLNEWRKYFPTLEKEFAKVAKVNDETYFRDFAVHYFLEEERKLERLKPDTIKGLPYYSKEFFKNASVQDVEDALKDIQEAFEAHNNKYQFYSFEDSRMPITYTYQRVDNYEPRPNQAEVIKNFRKAVDAGRSNLLMYAVMRFGKSFTSMCCAVEMDAKLVVVVSAKADVKQEWKRTVESHVKFKDYVFMDSDSLLAEENALSEKLKTNKAVVFLTLQDLMGPDIKAKHKQIFENEFDLLIVDESHYGARASEYGKVLRVTKTQLESELSDVDSADEYDNNETLKTLRPKVRLHLSGTPYRILMGDEFTKEDIIAFYQFTDIVKDQEAWNDTYLNKEVYDKEDEKEYGYKAGKSVQEWDNPYYGFPQMVRFAFNPNESSVKKMEEMKKKGITYAFSELFRPQSILKDTSSAHKHKKFVYEQEVLDLLEVIDGSKEDNNVLGFLDYPKIKEGKMCRHIVCVLPYRASCDALEALINDNKDKFRNLKDYEIINIAGVDDAHAYKDTAAVKDKIDNCEAKDQKTMTLTVNRMLTGSTVEQWDTMLYLKDTASPQEYDQAIFRLQNQYISKYKDENGDVIKYNMKPQTLLVDFSPNRMFHLQEQKSQIYNVNVDKNGNSKLEDRIKDELRISPIIRVNKNKLQEIEPGDILDAVREYSADKSVMDEATDIPADQTLLEDETIRKAIETLNPIDSSKGIDIKAAKGDGDDIDTPDGEEKGEHNPSEDKQDNPANENEAQPEESLDKKLATYYAEILFFAFLTDSNVKSLEEIINVIDANEDNKRLACDVGLRTDILKIIQQKSNPFILSKLDYKIQNLNTLMKDTSLPPDKRVEVAMKKFGRLSSSEIVTPMKVAKEMVDILPEQAINDNTRILDIASKQGEFTRALYNKFGDKIKNNIYAIPTSSCTYEFTRKVYSLLGMPIENIFFDFNSYDLIDNTKNETIMKMLQDMKFDLIIGNPPYQENNKGKGNGSDPIYHIFYDKACLISSRVSFIHPGRFLFNAGKTPKEWNDKVLNNEHVKVVDYWSDSKDVFDNVSIEGGIALTYFDKVTKFPKIGRFVAYSELRLITNKVVNRKDFVSFKDQVYTRDLYRLNSILYDENPWAVERPSKGHKFDVGSNVFGVLPELFYDTKPNDKEEYIQIYGRFANARRYKWIKAKYVQVPDNFKYFKIFISKADGAAGQIGKPIPARILGKTAIGLPNVGSTATFLSVGKFENKDEALAVQKYMATRFVRTMVATLKATQNNTREVWQNVPLQDFTSNSDIDWSKSISDIDKQLYKKYDLSEEEINFIESMIKPME